MEDAIIQGNSQIINPILNSGADPNSVNSQDTTALIWATGNNHSEVIEILIEAGADPDFEDKDGHTALSIAKDKGHSEILNYLRDNGATNEGGHRGCDCLHTH